MDPRPSAIELVREGFSETTLVIRLIFGLSTGALVLLANLLASLQAHWALLSILGLAIIAFGVIANKSLLLLVHFAEFRFTMAGSLIDFSASAEEKLQKQIADWNTKTKNTGMEIRRSFIWAVALTVVFIVGLVVTRAIQ